MADPGREPGDALGSAHAYGALRAAIVEQRYPPGHRLVEARLAADLGVSRTPVREALRRLEAEGLVASSANRGAVVRSLSPTEVADLYGLRLRLEAYAVEVATDRATAEELDRLADAAAAFEAAARAARPGVVDDLRAVHEANRRFHDGILDAARHRRLGVLLASTVDLPLVFQAFRSFGADELERSARFHHLVVAAMARRDGGRAAALMAEHVAQGRDAVLDDLEGELRR